MSMKGKGSPKFFLGELVVYNKELSAEVSDNFGVGIITSNNYPSEYYDVYFEKKKITLRFCEEVLCSIMGEEK